MCAFIQEVVSQEYNPGTDIILATGDFNIPYCPMPDSFKATLLKCNPDFKKGIEILD